MILGFLLACLPPVEQSESHPTPPLREDSPLHPQEELKEGVFWTGRLRGAPCAGRILMELRDKNAQQTFLSLTGTAYLLRFPDVKPLTLRYGCDDDGDGVVQPEAIASLTLETPENRKMDLSIPDVHPSSRVQLLTPTEVNLAGPAGPPPIGAAGPPPPGGAAPVPGAPPAGSAPPPGTPPDAPGPAPSGAGPSGTPAPSGVATPGTSPGTPSPAPPQ